MLANFTVAPKPQDTKDSLDTGGVCTGDRDRGTEIKQTPANTEAEAAKATSKNPDVGLKRKVEDSTIDEGDDEPPAALSDSTSDGGNPPPLLSDSESDEAPMLSDSESDEAPSLSDSDSDEAPMLSDSDSDEGSNGG